LAAFSRRLCGPSRRQRRFFRPPGVRFLPFCPPPAAFAAGFFARLHPCGAGARPQADNLAAAPGPLAANRAENRRNTQKTAETRQKNRFFCCVPARHPV